MEKFFNNAIIGNKKIVASCTDKGELQRFCYPSIDGKQFIDYFHIGLKINDSNIVYLHDDINNIYSQKYENSTNVVKTQIKNTYFELEIEQTDCVLISRDILVRKYIFYNQSKIDMNLSFIVNSKLLSNAPQNFGSKRFQNGIVQYNHDYRFCIFSRKCMVGHRLNDVHECVKSGVLVDKDYIGMSNEIAISYDIGLLRPKTCEEFYLYVWVGKNDGKIEQKINDELKFNDSYEIQETISYWQDYVKLHSAIKSRDKFSRLNKKILEIYNRSILLYPLLINYEHGGIAAALEVDDYRSRSGGYCYCWPRDAIFITKAFDLLKMKNETELFYNKFCKETQSNNGMWEQRFFTDSRLAPCWGYQVDETASVVYGIYEHYKLYKEKIFLVNNLKMCENAVNFLIRYVENILHIDEIDTVKKSLIEKSRKSFELSAQVSYDLWEMHEGVHLYSLCSIIASFDAMVSIYKIINDDISRLKKEKRNKLIQKMNEYKKMLLDYIKDNLIDDNLKTLKRNTCDNIVDISVMGSVYPFNVFNTNEKVVKNTVEKINMTLRTYQSGYLRFEGDSYMNGENPWVITTLWMALYYIRIGDLLSAEKCFKYVVNTSANHGFLSEQVSNDSRHFQWVIGLGWSHAMFIIVLDELLKAYEEREK